MPLRFDLMYKFNGHGAAHGAFGMGGGGCSPCLQYFFIAVVEYVVYIKLFMVFSGLLIPSLISVERQAVLEDCCDARFADR